MTELDEIRKRRLEELRDQVAQQQQDEFQEHFRLQQQVELIEQMAKPYLSSEAITRYGTLKSAHPEKAIRVAALIAQGVQSGQIKSLITDEQFKGLLQQIQPPKKEFKMVKK